MAVDPTLNARNQNKSIYKYIFEQICGGGTLYKLVDNAQQVDYEELAKNNGKWIVLEYGPSRIQVRMPISVLLTLSVRGTDSDKSIDAMQSVVREYLAPGSRFPMYDMGTRAQISSFWVRGYDEGVRLPQAGGGFDLTVIVDLRAGVIA